MKPSRPARRILRRRTQLIAIITCLILSSIALAALAKAPEPRSPKDGVSAASIEPDVTAVFNDVEALVKEYFPKARFVRTADKLHFDYKSRSLNGAQSGLSDLSPESGGVAGDIVVKPGKYTGKDRQPSETNMILHMVLFMAPYTDVNDHHFNTHLNYPPDIAVDFLSRFKEIIASQQHCAPDIADKPAAVASHVAIESANSTTAAAAPPTTSGSATDDPISALAVKPGTKESAQAKVSFGAKKLSKYSYPEGRFKVLLPGNPSTKYSNQLGMRSVDYSYPEANGAYVMSYLIAPGMIVENKIGTLLDAVCTNLAKTTKSVEVRRNSVSLQGFQGRQIELAPPGGKEQLARFRLYVVRRFIYIIGAAGSKAWVDSPVVAEYLNSLEVVPEYTVSEMQAYSASESKKKSDEAKRAFEESMAKSKRDFAESQSRNRKDFERARANSTYHRY